MKKLNFKKTLNLLFATVVLANNAYCQWSNVFGHLHPNFNTDIVGIGTTTSTAVLAVDGNPNSTGNVFSTDGLSSAPQTWAMNKGGTLYGQVGTYLTSYFGLLTPYQSNKSIVFHPNDVGRMIILASSGSDNGYVGLGRYGLFTPTSQLHQFQPDNTDVWHQFTNGIVIHRMQPLHTMA